MVKNFGDKKVWQKGCCNGLAKKLWQMLTYIANHQSTINSETKPSKEIPNYSLAHMARPLFWHWVLLLAV